MLDCDPAEKHAIESRNTALVADYVASFYERYEGRTPYFRSILLELHSLTIRGLYPCAGRLRTTVFDDKICIGGASFRPPPASDVVTDIIDLLERATAWRQISDLQGDTFEAMQGRVFFAADWFHRYLCVHPFAGGNGRVGRAFLHLMLYDMRALDPSDMAMWDYFSFRQPHYLNALAEADGGNLDAFRWLVHRGVQTSRNASFIKRIQSGTIGPRIIEMLPRKEQRCVDLEYMCQLPDTEYFNAMVSFTNEINIAIDAFAVKFGLTI